MKKQEPEKTDEKPKTIGPGVFVFSQDENTMTEIPTGYPEIYQHGYIEKTPHPGGGDSIFFG